MTDKKNGVPVWAWRSATLILWIITVSLITLGQKGLSAQLQDIDKTLKCHSERITALEQQRVANSDKIAALQAQFDTINGKLDKLLESVSELRGQQKGKQ